jgi:hypothetical protein
MKMKRRWQRGEADIISVAVGMVILSIIVAGTSQAMIYGRDVLIRQENEKAVAYLLRGYMDQWQSRIQTEEPERSTNQLGRAFVEHNTTSLTTVVAGGSTPALGVDLVRDPVREVRFTESGVEISWYELTCHARWTENPMPSTETPRGQARELIFRTYVVIRT